jgi:hypothetical protein
MTQVTNELLGQRRSRGFNFHPSLNAGQGLWAPTLTRFKFSESLNLARRKASANNAFLIIADLYSSSNMWRLEFDRNNGVVEIY